MAVNDTNCKMVGDFNSCSERWGNPDTDSRGHEVENYEIVSNLNLIKKQNDQPNF